uniref:Uncharacterized protein n=1 Tax=Fagus sylvatica TaxID=28930 RepID=A0A2N9ITP0_FAGSY
MNENLGHKDEMDEAKPNIRGAVLNCDVGEISGVVRWNGLTRKGYWNGRNDHKWVFEVESLEPWQVSTTTNVIKGSEKAFIRTLREHGKTFIIRQYSNKFGRYLEVLECGMGGRRERIVILEGQQQNGWKGFNKELRILLNLEPRTNKHQLQWGVGRVGARGGKECEYVEWRNKIHGDREGEGQHEGSSGKGITIHINQSGHRQVGQVFVDGPSDSWVTEDKASSGFGPWSTYEVGESSWSTKQQNGLGDELRVSMGLESSHNRDGLIDRETISIQMERLVRGAEKFNPPRGTAFGDYVRDAEEIQYLITVHDPLALVPSPSTILAREPMEDTDVLDISPIRTCYGEIT